MRTSVVALALILAAGAFGQVGELEFCTVTGKVTDEQGRLLKGARLEIRPASVAAVEQPQSPFTSSMPSPSGGMNDTRRDNEVFAWATSDNEGRYSMPGVKKPGAYMLVVRAPGGYREARVPLSIAAAVGDEFHADVVLQKLPGKAAKGKGEYQAAMEAAQASERGGDLAAARSHLEVATRLEPDSPIPHYHLARLALAQGEIERARHEAGLSVGRGPRCVDCWVMRARCERGAGNPGASRQAAEKALALSAESAGAHGVLGLLLFDAGSFGDALGHLDAAVAAGDRDPAVHLALANAYLKLRQAGPAVHAYRAYLERFPDASNRPEVERILAALTSP